MSMALVMSQMPDVWRKVLAEHVGDERGRCRACRNANGETAAWPCQTYRVAQEAKWVAEGNLPGTGPHGADGPSATPRLSPLEDPRHRTPEPAPFAGDPAPGGWGGSGFDLPRSGGWSPGGDDHLLPGSRGVDPPRTGGWDRPSTEGWDRPSTGGWDRPSTGGWDRPSTGGWDRPSTGGWESPGYPLTDPAADDAATAFGGGQGSSGPALASLPPLPPTAGSPPPSPAAWNDPLNSPVLRDDPPRRDPWRDDPWGEEPRHRGGAHEAAPYGSRVDAPYGSTFGVDDRPRGARH